MIDDMDDDKEESFEDKVNYLRRMSHRSRDELRIAIEPVSYIGRIAFGADALRNGVSCMDSSKEYVVDNSKGYVIIITPNGKWVEGLCTWNYYEN